MPSIMINKNRGWRGLAELVLLDEEDNIQKRVIFSFSQKVWEDMLFGHIVMQDEDYYYVLIFDNTARLPQTQQRSVLIKNFTATVLHIAKYNKATWVKDANLIDYDCISNFNENKNNHTKSNWNYVGIRVKPMI